MFTLTGAGGEMTHRAKARWRHPRGPLPGVERAAVMAVTMERAARLQLTVQTFGEIKRIDPALAGEAYDYRLQAKHVAASFSYYARQGLRASSDCLDCASPVIA